MEKIPYPLLYFQLREDALLGILVGSEYQILEKDLRSLKKAFTDYLLRQYKKTDEYPITGIREPKLKVVEVSIRPTYRDERGSYPAENTLSVPVPVVYGEAEQGYFLCYLPLFNESFYYYDARQFDALVHHFVTLLLNQVPPERIFQFMRYKQPRLEKITLKVNPDREFLWSGFRYQRPYETLTRLAEKYPYPRNIRSAMSNLPEAAWELEDKVSEVLDKLINSRANILIVGPHGVGKSAVLRQAIRKISGQSGKQKLDFTFWRIMSQRITSSTQYLGEWQEVCELLVEELFSSNGILWVVDLIQMLQSGGEGPEDSVAAFMLPFIQHDRLQMIGEATPEELESMRRLLPGFVQAFHIVRLEELPEQKIHAIQQQFAEYIQKKYAILIRRDALALAYRLLLRYFPYESFPGKSLKFLGQCVNEAQLTQQNEIDKSAVIDQFIRQTGMPELFLRDEVLLDAGELSRYFSKRIIGQPVAVDKLTSIVKVFKAGLNNPHRPIATLIFAGPTGVGKTASAKALAEYFFGMGQKRSPLIRIDMSEFQHSSQIIRLIGSGKQAGQLVREIRERPFSVLLLDEIEKADPSLFDSLLTVLDEGLLVDAFGRVTHFRNTIIIMTSNLGAGRQQSIGYQQTTSEENTYISAIEQYFRPEFFNRIDGVVVFRSLSERDVREITEKELETLQHREGFQKRGLALRFAAGLVDYLVSIGFDDRYGARPLQRAIEYLVVTPLANWLLEHPEKTGCVLHLDWNEELLIRPGLLP